MTKLNDGNQGATSTCDTGLEQRVATWLPVRRPTQAAWAEGAAAMIGMNIEGAGG